MKVLLHRLVIQLGDSTQSCKWVRNNESEMLCLELMLVKNCPEFCGCCNEDDATLFYEQINGNNDMRTCSWIISDTRRQKVLQKEHIRTYNRSRYYWTIV